MRKRRQSNPNSSISRYFSYWINILLKSLCKLQNVHYYQYSCHTSSILFYNDSSSNHLKSTLGTADGDLARFRHDNDYKRTTKHVVMTFYVMLTIRYTLQYFSAYF